MVVLLSRYCAAPSLRPLVIMAKRAHRLPHILYRTAMASANDLCDNMKKHKTRDTAAAGLLAE